MTLRRCEDRSAAAAFAADRLEGIVQHVAHFSFDARAGGQLNYASLAHNQQHQLIVLQVFRHDADKRSSCRIQRLLFQLIQTAQALRQDHARVESRALGCAQPHPAAIADQQDDLGVELLRGGRNDGLQSGAIKML